MIHSYVVTHLDTHGIILEANEHVIVEEVAGKRTLFESVPPKGSSGVTKVDPIIKTARGLN